jgi:hypothetical protein
LNGPRRVTFVLWLRRRSPKRSAVPSLAGSAAAVEEAKAPAGEERPSQGTLALLYDEIGGALQAQHAYVESLNGRAQQLFGFATVILAIVGAVVPTNPSTGLRILYGIALPIFAAAAYFSGRAWRFRKFRSDPDVGGLWMHLRFKSEEYVRHQVILNRRESLETNDKELEDKLRLIKRAQFWLYCGFIYVWALLLYQVITG